MSILNNAASGRRHLSLPAGSVGQVLRHRCPSAGTALDLVDEQRLASCNRDQPIRPASLIFRNVPCRRGITTSPATSGSTLVALRASDGHRRCGCCRINRSTADQQIVAGFGYSPRVTGLPASRSTYLIAPTNHRGTLPVRCSKYSG
jgi:hypothetical protein